MLTPDSTLREFYEARLKLHELLARSYQTSVDHELYLLSFLEDKCKRKAARARLRRLRVKLDRANALIEQTKRRFQENS